MGGWRPTIILSAELRMVDAGQGGAARQPAASSQLSFMRSASCCLDYGASGSNRLICDAHAWRPSDCRRRNLSFVVLEARPAAVPRNQPAICDRGDDIARRPRGNLRAAAFCGCDGDSRSTADYRIARTVGGKRSFSERVIRPGRFTQSRRLEFRGLLLLDRLRCCQTRVSLDELAILLTIPEEPRAPLPALQTCHHH